MMLGPPDVPDGSFPFWGAAGAVWEEPAGVLMAISPLPRRPPCADGCTVTCEPVSGVPLAMACRMLATPGMVTVASMLLTCMSSAQAYLSGNTRMTLRLPWASSKAFMAPRS